jgi:hypothetical protein
MERAMTDKRNTSDAREKDLRDALSARTRPQRKRKARRR